MSPKSRKGDKKRRRTAWWQMGIVVVISASIIVSFGLNVAGPGRQSEYPERLGTLELVGAVEGEEAMSRVDGLHGVAVELKSAYVVEYVRGRERGSVWVGITDSSTTARALTERMRASIEEGNSAFSNISQIQVSGMSVYRVEGPGGDHYFYHSERRGKQIVWLTVNAAHPQDILTEAIKYY